MSGNIFVFASPDSGATQVRFYLDNPSASGTPLWTENNPPWDFAGGTVSTASPYDTHKLPMAATDYRVDQPLGRRDRLDHARRST